MKLSKAYFKVLEHNYRVRVDSRLKAALISHFEVDGDYPYTDQDVCEQSRKIIQAYLNIKKKRIVRYPN